MAENDQNRNAESGREEGGTAKGTDSGSGDTRSGTISVNPDTGDMGIASSDYRDPHGNQNGREPEGGSGAGQSRGDQSSYNPGNPSANDQGDRRQELQGYPVGGSEEGGTSGHDQPAEGGRDQYGTQGEATEDPRI